jgi:hypothetical protein
MRQHLAGKDGNGLAIMSGFSFRAWKDNFTAGKHAREKRFRASIALCRPAMRRTDRFFEIIDPARWTIASAQAPGDLELAPRTFGVGTREKLFIGESGPRQFKISVYHGRKIRASCRFGLRLRPGRLDGEELLCGLFQYRNALAIAQTGCG